MHSTVMRSESDLDDDDNDDQSLQSSTLTTSSIFTKQGFKDMVDKSKAKYLEKKKKIMENPKNIKTFNIFKVLAGINTKKEKVKKDKKKDDKKKDDKKKEDNKKEDIKKDS